MAAAAGSCCGERRGAREERIGAAAGITACTPSRDMRGPNGFNGRSQAAAPRHRRFFKWVKARRRGFSAEFESASPTAAPPWDSTGATDETRPPCPLPPPPGQARSGRRLGETRRSRISVRRRALRHRLCARPEVGGERRREAESWSSSAPLRHRLRAAVQTEHDPPSGPELQRPPGPGDKEQCQSLLQPEPDSRQ